jgi:SAM-dependent methyltransferase
VPWIRPLTAALGLRDVFQNLAQRSERLMARNFWREQGIANHLGPHLPRHGEILDLGAGSCKLAQHLTEQLKHRVTALDIVDHNVTPLSLQLYSGNSVPFSDNSFDTVILVFVLHHATSPEVLLREAVRVAKSKVVVVEDAPASTWQRHAWRTWDYLLNHGTHEDVHIGRQPPTVEGWVRQLSALGFPPCQADSFRTAFPVAATFRHALFVIDKLDGRHNHPS